MKKILNFCSISLGLVIVSCNSNSVSTNTDLSKGTIKEWIVPKENNWKILKEVVLETGGKDLFHKMFFYNLPNNEFGIITSVYWGGTNTSQATNLYQIKDEYVTVVKTKNESLAKELNNQEVYSNDNIYWQLPNIKDASHWYFHSKEIQDSCVAYWSTCNIKNEQREVLVIERRTYSTTEGGKLVDITKEIYQKNKGIYEIDAISVESGKVLSKYIVADVGFDKTIDNNQFSLSVNNANKNTTEPSSENNNAITITNQLKEFWKAIAINYHNKQMPQADIVILNQMAMDEVRRLNKNINEVTTMIENVEYEPDFQEKILKRLVAFSGKEQMLKSIFAAMSGSHSISDNVATYAFQKYPKQSK